MALLEELNNRAAGTLAGLIGVEIIEAEKGRLSSRLELRDELMAANGYLHAATIVALADTSCGYGTFVSLPQAAQGFTTIELKSNFLGTKQAGFIECKARMAHGGCNTQVWDAEVKDADSGKTLALFRCTQMILYPNNSTG